MRLDNVSPPNVINGFIEAIMSLRHVFRDCLQDPLILWFVLISWNRFECYLGGIEIRAYFQAWLLSSNTCYR